MKQNKSTKLERFVKKLLVNHSADQVVDELIKIFGYVKVMQMFCNRCVFKSQDKNRKQGNAWYRAARIFHRAIDETKIENKAVFKVARRDIYGCEKCKKRFRADAATEKNCKYDLDKNVFIVKCPKCGKTDA